MLKPFLKYNDYMKRTSSEKEILKKLGASDFRSLNKQQIIEFISQIPNMSEKVALKCLEQVPYFIDASKSVVNNFCDLCKKIANDDSIALEEIKAYHKIIDSIQKRIDSYDGYIPKDEYDELLFEMKEAAKKIEGVATRRERFKENVMRHAEGAVAFVVGIGTALLGGKFLLRK